MVKAGQISGPTGPKWSYTIIWVCSPEIQGGYFFGTPSTISPITILSKACMQQQQQQQIECNGVLTYLQKKAQTEPRS